MDEGFYEDARNIEEKANDGEDVYEADEQVEELTAEDADGGDGEGDAEVFAEKCFYREDMVSEGLGSLKNGEDGEIEPEIAVQAGVIFFFEHPATEKDDEGNAEHFDRLIEKGVGGVADKEEYGKPVHPGGVRTLYGVARRRRGIGA